MRIKPLSATQALALAMMGERDGVLERRAGGYWTYPGCGERPSRSCPVPLWRTAERTINTLLLRCDVVVLERHAKFGYPVRIGLSEANRRCLEEERRVASQLR